MKENLIKNLKKLRKKENLSQEQLAEILGVTRQSVSKWETGDAYPEMEKIIFLCKEYNLNVNDLLNGDIYEAKQKKEAFKEMYNTIDKTVNFFVDSFSLFFKMTFKTKIIFILEISFLFLVLGITFFIGGEILKQIFGNLLYLLFPAKVYSIVVNLLSFLFYFITSVLSLAIVAKIVKERYLKYDNKIVELEKNDNESETISLNKTVKNKIILRDPMDSNYRIFNAFYKIIICTLKLFLGFILIPFIMILIFLSFTLIGSLLVFKTGFLFIGLVVVILGAISLIVMFILLLANFLFNRRNNYKLFIYTSLINFIVIGVGFGLIFIGSLSLDISTEYSEKLFTTKEEILEMKNNYIIENYNIVGDIEFIIEDRKDLKITYDYNKVFVDVHKKIVIEQYDDKDYCNIYISPYYENRFKVLKNILKSINNDKRLSYSDSIYNFKIYASKENIEILKNNLKIKAGG